MYFKVSEMSWPETQRHNKAMYALFPRIQSINNALAASHPELWETVANQGAATAMLAILKHFNVSNDGKVSTWVENMEGVLSES